MGLNEITCVRTRWSTRGCVSWQAFTRLADRSIGTRYHSRQSKALTEASNSIRSWQINAARDISFRRTYTVRSYRDTLSACMPRVRAVTGREPTSNWYRESSIKPRPYMPIYDGNFYYDDITIEDFQRSRTRIEFPASLSSPIFATMSSRDHVNGNYVSPFARFDSTSGFGILCTAVKFRFHPLDSVFLIRAEACEYRTAKENPGSMDRRLGGANDLSRVSRGANTSRNPGEKLGEPISNG